jgi:hypothetical protein
MLDNGMHLQGSALERWLSIDTLHIELSNAERDLLQYDIIRKGDRILARRKAAEKVWVTTIAS